MATAAAIEAELRAAHPSLRFQDGKTVEELASGDPRYEARMAEMVAARLAKQEQASAEAAKKTLRQQAAQGIAMLDGLIADLENPPAGLTTAQRLEALRDGEVTLATIMRRVIVVLRNAGIVEPDGEENRAD